MNGRDSGRLWSGILIWVFLAWAAAPPARALVVATTTGNTSAPEDDFGFAYVGKRDTTAAVYLGYGWMLTAEHTGTGWVELNGVVYNLVADSEHVLLDPTGKTSQADVALFQVRDASQLTPRLAPLTISATSPPVGSTVTMVSRGNTRSERLYGWEITGSYPEGTDWIWSDAYSPPVYGENELRGFGISGTQQMRWGTNEIDAYTGLIIYGRYVVCMRTKFDEFDEFGDPLPDAQVMGKDSGGGVFFKRGDDWELAGLISMMSESYYDLYPGQPANTLMLTSISETYSMYSYLGDLSVYRDQILDIIMPIPGDASLDGVVNDVDASILAAHWLMPADALWEDGDFNGDGNVNDADAAILAAHWHEGVEQNSTVPEPAVLAMLAGALAALRLIRRCVD
jgi:hypothetical protein